LMKTVAGRLSDDQIAAVAAYYETLPATASAKGQTP
jgi:cytochrome c553